MNISLHLKLKSSIAQVQNEDLQATAEKKGGGHLDNKPTLPHQRDEAVNIHVVSWVQQQTPSTEGNFLLLISHGFEHITSNRMRNGEGERNENTRRKEQPRSYHKYSRLQQKRII